MAKFNNKVHFDTISSKNRFKVYYFCFPKINTFLVFGNKIVSKLINK